MALSGLFYALRQMSPYPKPTNWNYLVIFNSLTGSIPDDENWQDTGLTMAAIVAYTGVVLACGRPDLVMAEEPRGWEVGSYILSDSPTVLEKPANHVSWSDS